MKLKIRIPLLPPKLLLPLIILLDRPLPILRPLHVLAALLGVRFGAQGFGEFELFFAPGEVADGGFEFGGFGDEVLAVLAGGVELWGVG